MMLKIIKNCCGCLSGEFSIIACGEENQPMFRAL